MGFNPLFPDEDDLGDSYQQAVLMDDSDEIFVQDDDDEYYYDENEGKKIDEGF